MISRFQVENEIVASGLPDETTLNAIDDHLQRVLPPAMRKTPPQVAQAPDSTVPPATLPPTPISLPLPPVSHAMPAASKGLLSRIFRPSS
jgi:hypothetical protein